MSRPDPVDYQTSPDRYRHWKLSVEGAIAALRANIDEDGGLRPGYKLKLNSCDLGVDIELDDARPNNVDLSSDKQLRRALETWRPNYLDWWNKMGPEGFQPAGELVSEDDWQARHLEWLPNDADMKFIDSLMKPSHERGKYASWIAPPRVGINNRPGDFEYVKIV